MARSAKPNPDEINVILEVPPETIDPPHEVTDLAKVQALIASYEQSEAWEGRPLLVEPRGDGTYKAWTGSHRLKAARGIWALVPVFALDVDALDEAHGKPRGTHFDEAGEAHQNRTKLEYLSFAGDHESADLIAEEIAANHQARENPFLAGVLPKARRARIRR